MIISALVLLLAGSMLSACSDNSITASSNESPSRQSANSRIQIDGFQSGYKKQTSVSENTYLATKASNNTVTVPVEGKGTVTAYVDVPRDFECHITVPDLPTAFCQGTGSDIYHLSDGRLINGYVSPESLLSEIENLLTQDAGTHVIAKNTAQEIAQHIANRDASLLFKRGQQVFAYFIETHNPASHESAALVVAVHHIPNNGAPVTALNLYAISKPGKGQIHFDTLRHDLFAFIQSYRYDSRWIQSANIHHASFERNLSARNRTFQIKQNLMHHNNRDALDSSFNSYMNRSDSSDRMQQLQVDSIRERQQLVDYATGQRYDAEGYYENNSVNPYDSAMAVRSNNPNWDPNINTHQGMNFNRLEEYHD